MTQLILGDCIEKLRELPDNSVDSIVTDPPYELGFMGKSWDASGIAYNKDVWRECLRVLKHGGHLLAFSGTRTYHRMAVAIEDAGFEIRDMIEWCYGSGFPKSLNIGKRVNQLETKGTSEWEGWGTALKPAHEPICMARKPLAEKTVAENVLKWGSGGINIDESRVETSEELNYGTGKKSNVGFKTSPQNNDRPIYSGQGRFPANLIHDGSDEVVACFPDNKGAFAPVKSGQKGFGGVIYGKYETGGDDGKTFYGDGLSNASRFFKSIIYVPKASKAERNRGCEGLDYIRQADRVVEDGVGGDNPRNRTNTPKQNFHPTVKPVALMEYLIKMVTPKGGTVLDPFMGSGSTGVAAKQNDFKFIGIDITPEYIEIAKARINGVKEQTQTVLFF